MYVVWRNVLMRGSHECTPGGSYAYTALPLTQINTVLGKRRVIIARNCTLYRNLSGWFSGFVIFGMIAQDASIVRMQIRN